jgi:radical SAM superfamily enzyme YgiQ (UPF0313 family)
MKVCLINPDNNLYHGSPPISLAILAGYLRKHGHTLKIVDLATGEDYKREILIFKPEVVGITATSPVITLAYEIADYCTRCGFKVIMGGAHVSVKPDEALKHAQTVVVGEGEVVFKEYLNEINKNPQLVSGILNAIPIENLDDIPIPAYDLLNMEFYLSSQFSKLITCLPENTRMGSMLTSRGCPYNCTFCHNSFKNLKYRFHSAKRVVDEIEYLIKNHNIHALFFIEDNFFVNKERVKEVCNLMIDRGIKIFWGANARVDNLDKETLVLAKKAGCIQVTFGWESGSQKMLDKYNKKTTVKQNEDSIKLCNEVGLMANGTVMIGGPDETMEDIELTRKFMVENFISGGCGVCTTTPFPGTKMWEDLEKEGKLSDIDWGKFNFSYRPVKMDNLSDEDFYNALNRLRTICELTVKQSKLNFMKRFV